MTYTENLAYRPKAATPSEDDDNEDDDVMVIGIDFGTTYVPSLNHPSTY
jgi:hypothetical protein